MPTANPLEISPQDIEALRLSGESLAFIDVREPAEWAVARIEGAELIPMGSVPASLQRLEAAADESSLVIYCHHGVRSLQVVSWLRQQGISSCYSLAGGIDRWSREVDAAVPTY
jgi:rhodanese-related sulfurtransferase